MERNRWINLYQNVVRARKLELDLFDLDEKEMNLQKQIEELEQIKKRSR